VVKSRLARHSEGDTTDGMVNADAAVRCAQATGAMIPNYDDLWWNAPRAPKPDAESTSRSGRRDICNLVHVCAKRQGVVAGDDGKSNRAEGLSRHAAAGAGPALRFNVRIGHAARAADELSGTVVGRARRFGVGWGVHFTHQGDKILAKWFTCDADGPPLWLSAPLDKALQGAFTGTLYRTTGPAFSAGSFDPNQVALTPVGTLMLTFANGNSGTFAYVVNGISQAKSITRQILRGPGTLCQ